MIVVDDHSDDDTVARIAEYVPSNIRLKLLKTEKNVMAGGARNIGLKNATGQYISFIDSDDWIDSNFLASLLEVIQSTNSDVAVCGVKREYSNAKNSTVRYAYNKNNVINGDFALSLLSRVIDQDISISAIVCNKLFRTQFIIDQNLQFFENCHNEDDVFIFSAFLHTDSVAITNQTNYHLYQRQNSASRDFSTKHIDDLFFAFKEIKKILIAKDLYCKYKYHYYAFFEKCLNYIIESIRRSEQDDQKINQYFKYAYSLKQDAISMIEFIDYCGHRRLESFFSDNS